MKKLLTMFAITGLLASPARGSVRDAAFTSSADRHVTQTSIFAGATYRVGLDKRTAEQRGRASLAFTGMTRTPTANLKLGQGLQLSGGQTGKLAFFVGGQDLGQMQKHKSNLSGGTTAVIIGVVLVAAIVAAVAISEATKCEEDCAPAGGS